MTSLKKCSHIKSHCRKISSGKAAKRPCSPKTGGKGTMVKGHHSPKALCNKSAIKLQTALRAMSARRKVSAKRNSKSVGTKRKAPPPAVGVRKSARVTKANPKYK